MMRVGYNPNTNMLPMFHFLPKEHLLLDLVKAEPTGHNAMLADGRIDMAPVSAFSYAEHWRDYAVLPNLSVSNRGRVGSILLFSKVELKELDGLTVALADTSATSVNLLKVLLQHYYGVFPRYVTKPPDLPAMFAEADAALLIADAAIQAAFQKPDCFVFDLGEEWLRQTDCSMTYALWAFPRRLIPGKGEEIRTVHGLLLKAKEEALSNMDQVVHTCREMLGGSLSFWHSYFERFNYGLDQAALNGLSRYLDLCYEQKLLPSRPELYFWPEER